MDKITETSAKRLIVLDCIDFLASQMFGDKYTYSMHVVAHDPLEELTKLEQPIWNTILGDESSELFDMGKTIANDILINVHVTAPVPSTNIAHAIPYLEDIDALKQKLIGQELQHKGNYIYGDFQNEAMPISSITHNIEYAFGAAVLRLQFAIVLRIYQNK